MSRTGCWGAVLGAILIAGIFGPASAIMAQVPIFADGFESGDLRGWDTTPPEITNFSPAPGAWLAELRPTVSASFGDAVGVDPATFELLVDGVDRTAEASVTAGGFGWTPAEDLVEGLRLVLVRIADLAGNPTANGWSFGVDLGAPVAIVPNQAAR